MFHAISKRIIVHAIKHNALKVNQAEEYIYGLEITMSVLASYTSVIMLGLLMKMFMESLIFLALLVLIRRFTGGFHFRSQVACYLSMCVVCLLVLLIIKYGGSYTAIYNIVMIMSSLVLLVLSPVSAIEKPFDEKETVVYGRIARGLILIISIIYFVLYFEQQISFVKIIAVTMCVVAIFAILGKLKQKLYKTAKKQHLL